jgi:RNA polymerase sigma-70 factor (ECF subfamily)
VDQRDHDQFAELFVLNQSRVYRYIIGFVPNRADADELFQQTNLTIWKTWDRFDPTRPFLPWAYAIAQNHVRNFLRRRQNQPRLFSEDFLDELAQVHLEEDQYIADRQEALARCLEKLPARQRELVECRYAAGQSMTEVAAGRGQSIEAAYKAIQRVRALLFDCISQAMELEARG